MRKTERKRERRVTIDRELVERRVPCDVTIRHTDTVDCVCSLAW